MIQSQVHTPGLGPGAPDHLSLPGQGRRVWLCSQRGGSQPASCLQGPAPTQGPAPPKSGCRPTALQGTPTSPWWTSWRPPISSKPTPRASSNPPPLTDASPHISPSPDSPLFSTSPPPRSERGSYQSDKLAGALWSRCSVSVSGSSLANTDVGSLLSWRNNAPLVELPRPKVGQLLRPSQSSLSPAKPATESTCRDQTCEIQRDMTIFQFYSNLFQCDNELKYWVDGSRGPENGDYVAASQLDAVLSEVRRLEEAAVQNDEEMLSIEEKR